MLTRRSFFRALATAASVATFGLIPKADGKARDFTKYPCGTHELLKSYGSQGRPYYATAEEAEAGDAESLRKYRSQKPFTEIGYYLDGEYSHLGRWDRALTEDEVKAVCECNLERTYKVVTNCRPPSPVGGLMDHFSCAFEP